MHYNTILYQFAKAQLTAVAATVVDFSITALLFTLWKHSPALCTCIGAVCGGVVNCLLNYRWTFRSQNPSVRRVVWRYAMVWGGSVALNTFGTTLLFYLMTHLWDQPGSTLTLTIAKVVVAVVVAIFWNFLLQKYFVFRGRMPQELEDATDDKEWLI